jgi:virulence-associated protein VagC
MKAKLQFDSTAKNLEALAAGSKVWIQNPISKKWDSAGTVLEKKSKRSYDVEDDEGATYRRNRRFLRPRSAPIDALKEKESSIGDNEEPVTKRRSKRIADQKMRVKARSAL